MISMILAVLTAGCNATASVLQRRAARQMPRSESFRLSLMIDLIRTPTWLAGIGALILGFLLQAAALATGELAIVQPILVVELPFTLLIARLAFEGRIGRRAWFGTLSLTIGLAVALFAASPSGGTVDVPTLAWVLAAVVTAAVVAGLIAGGVSARQDSLRAALLGAASGVSFAFTAALIKAATNLYDNGLAAVFTSWPVYAMVLAGITSVFLLQNALQSGTLVAAQPAITTSDPLVSTAYGVLLFQEHLRLGVWILPEVVGIALIVIGSTELARSPLVNGQTAAGAFAEADS